jgi:hypothetical protein
LSFELYDLIKRKFVTTVLATMIASMLLSFYAIKSNTEYVYNQGEQFIGWFFVILMYAGAIILIYGNLVSIVVEYVQKKWFEKHDWLYVVILGMFGLANGFIFREVSFAFYGMLAALLYAVIDRWLYRRETEVTNVKKVLFAPAASVLLLWGYFQAISPPLPPFTIEHAVEFATSGEGTPIENFPKEIGELEDSFDGYQIKRETSAKEIGDELYLVTFKENWMYGDVKGSWSISYKVDRGSSTADREEGYLPPYYKKR